MGLKILTGAARTLIKVAVDRSMTPAQAQVRSGAKGSQKITSKPSR